MTDAAKLQTVVDALKKLQQELEEYKITLGLLGKYETNLLADKIAPSKVPIETLVAFFNSMKEATQALQQFNPVLTGRTKTSYTAIRDKIYRHGKYDRYGTNRCSNSEPIVQECHIFLGRPPGTWKCNVGWILKKWSQYVTDKPEYLKAYTLEAWSMINDSFGLIKAIEKVRKELVALI